MKSLAAAFLLAFSCLGASPDVPVYPGAVVDERVTASIRKSNPQNVGYATADSFERVDAYYQKIGGQDVPGSRRVNEDLKFVVMTFPGKTFRAGLSWVAADKKHTTVIQLILKP